MARPELPFYLYIDASTDGLSAILCQEHEGRHKAIHFVGRSLSSRELGLSLAETLLLGAAWAMRKLRTYTEFGFTYIVVPDQASITVFRDREAHSSIRARLMDLLCYRCKIITGKSSWTLGSEILAES